MALTHEAQRRSESLYAVCQRVRSVPEISADGASKVETVLGWIAQHSQAARRDPIGVVALAALHDTGYLKLLANQSEEQSREAMRVLGQFWKRVERFAEEEALPTTARFLELIDLSMDAGDTGFLPPDPEAGPELVRVMTVHGAKGLEFSHVFVVNLVDRRFPTTERRDPIPLPDVFIKEHLPEGDAHLQEERRLLYVAMTRAKDALYLTSADEYGGARAKKLSRFLVEAGFEPVSAESREPMIEIEPEPRPAFAGFKIPKRMSFTQFAAFSTCPLQYKFEHLLRIPKRGNENQSFGQSVHSTLQEWFERYRARASTTTPTLFDAPDATVRKPISAVVPLDEVLELYREKFVDEWYSSAQSKTARYELGRKMLAAYYAEVKDTTPDIVGLEVGFTIKVGAATVKGRMDRIDRMPDGSVEILDYKTGRAKDNPDKDQLFIYQLAVSQVLKEKPGQLTFLYMDGLSRVSFLATPEELAVFEERMSKTAEAIRRSDFLATPSVLACKFCDFRSICEHRV